jgi:2'-5' RNA ligase
MRCFIALDISDEIRKAIAGMIQKASIGVRGIRWVSAENIHLTLKFLGEVKEELIPEMQKRLSEACARHKAFPINIRGTGAFPNPKYPNVLWVGIDKSEELKRLYLDIDEAMSSLGFEKEDRDFSPHLTIGRVKDKRGIEPALKELYTFKDAFFGSIDVTEILLMKSVLKSSGAEYSKIAVFRLSRLERQKN